MKLSASSAASAAGEMVFPWLFEDFAELRKIREAAEVLAKSTDWGPLYKADQLSSNTVPVAAATYFEVRW